MMSLAGGNTPNASTVSLPIKGNQLGYRKAVSAPAPPGVRNPLNVLEGILGAPLVTGKGEVWMPEARDAEDVAFAGLSLDEFVMKAEEELGSAVGRKREYNEQSVGECWFLSRRLWG